MNDNNNLDPLHNMRPEDLRDLFEVLDKKEVIQSGQIPGNISKEFIRETQETIMDRMGATQQRITENITPLRCGCNPKINPAVIQCGCCGGWICQKCWGEVRCYVCRTPICPECSKKYKEEVYCLYDYPNIFTRWFTLFFKGLLAGIIIFFKTIGFLIRKFLGLGDTKNLRRDSKWDR